MNLLAQAFAALLFTCSLLSWAWIAARVGRGQPLLGDEPRRPVPWRALDLLIIAMVFSATTALLALALNAVFAGGTNGRIKQFEVALSAGTAGNLSTIGFAVVWLVWRVGASASDLGWRVDMVGRDLRTGLVAFAALSVPIYGMQYVLSHFSSEQHPIIEALGQQPSSWLFVLSGISAVIVAPLAEEFFFRGLLQGWLESLPMRTAPTNPASVAPDLVPGGGEAERILPAAGAESLNLNKPADENPYRSPLALPNPRSALLDASRLQRWRRSAILITSLIFALMHWGHGLAPVPLFFLSLALGWIYQRTHRLLPSIVVHFCLNACSLMMLPFALSSPGR